MVPSWEIRTIKRPCEPQRPKGQAGAGCRAVVTISDRGRNLFDLVDRDGDDRVDLAELTRAGWELPSGLVREKVLPPSRVPASSYRLVAGCGSVGNSFGPVPLGLIARPKVIAKSLPVKGPRWFGAMDRNGDGIVSAAEFLGPPHLFAKFDRDADGRIGQDEADEAGR